MRPVGSSKGILPYQQIADLIIRGIITAERTVEDRQIQPASLDLRLGKKAYRLISSFLPELSPISNRLNVLDFYQSDLVMYEMDLTQGAILEKGQKQSAVVPLTTREQAVLLLLAQGRSNKDVAGELDISVRTVETHRKNIKKKLGISTTAGLTRYVIDHGLMADD